MDLVCKKRFNLIRKEFLGGNYNLHTIEWFVNEIRDMICEISENEFRELIEIPKSILQQDVEIKECLKWQSECKKCFMGNISMFKERFFIELNNKMMKEDYFIEDMINTIEYMKVNFELLRKNNGVIMERPLRNIQLTFRYCTITNTNSLLQNGDLFGKIIGDVIGL